MLPCKAVNLRQAYAMKGSLSSCSSRFTNIWCSPKRNWTVHRIYSRNRHQSFTFRRRKSVNASAYTHRHRYRSSLTGATPDFKREAGVPEAFFCRPEAGEVRPDPGASTLADVAGTNHERTGGCQPP